MYESQRIIIDTRKYDVDEVFERYRRGQLIFYKKRNPFITHKNKVIREVLEALLRGIPFPPVYVSELQNGALLVLEKSDRLRYLMEYLDSGFERNSRYGLGSEEIWDFSKKMEKHGLEKHIYYSSIMLHVIDYMNPKYMHMQVGAFIEEWAIGQEQSIWNILYRGNEMEIFEKLLSRLTYTKSLEVVVQYNLIYFIMVHLVASRYFHAKKDQDSDRFQLLEGTLYGLQHIEERFLFDLCGQFEELYHYMSRKKNRSGVFAWISSNNRTKYLCFMGIWLRIRGEDHFMEVFQNIRIRNMVENCDMSFLGISRIVDVFREGDLW